MKISILNGHLLDPASQLDKKQALHVADGEIAALGRAPAGFQPDLEIDAKDCIVCPGLIDLCTHLPEPGREHKGSMASETLAAVSGGVTSLCCQPDTLPILDNPAVAELVHQRARQVNRARVLPLAALTEGLAGKTLTDMNAMKTMGCIGVSNGNRDIANAEVLRRALEYAASCDMTVFLFCEDPDLKNNGVVHEGSLATRLGLPAIPASAEILSVSRALLLAEQTGARIHISRISCGDSVAMIKAAQTRGLPVTADVAISHLHLDDTAVDEFNALCHLAPPLRAESDRQALIAGLRDGSISAICSDHFPHDVDAKSAPFSQTEAGASTVEHLLALSLKLVTDKQLSSMQALAALSCQPAHIIGLDLGRLAPGLPADICIFNPREAVTIQAADMLSQGKNTPFEDWTINGKVNHTLVNGRPVYPA